MVKKFSDEEFDAFLQKEFLHEADMVESALFSDEDFEKIELSDEEVEASYQRLIEKLKRDGVYREETHEADMVESALFSDEDFEKIELSDEEVEASYQRLIEKLKRDGVYREETDTETFRIEDTGRKSKKRHSHSLVRAAGFVVICVLGVFAASMTSEANRKYFIESLRYVAGDDTRVVINNDEADAANRDEYAAMDKIERELGVKMPEFTYRPMGLRYYNCEVVRDAGIGRMEYQYGDTIIMVVVDKNNEVQAGDSIGLHGKKYETLSTVSEDENIAVDIIEIQDKRDSVKTYTAQWNFQEAFYQVSGKFEKSELEKMIQYMKY